MQFHLRVARIDVSGYRLLMADFSGLAALHGELQAVIRRHLPATTASLLALPAPGDDGKTVDWYTDLTGQPAQLTRLPGPARTAAKAKLEQRLATLRRLADELPGRVRGSASIADALRAACQYPDDSHVYVVGDEPVLTLWGFVLVDPRRGGALGTRDQAARRRARRRWTWGLTAALVLVLTSAAGVWFWLDHLQSESLRTELGRTLASACAEPDLAIALDSRLERLDPEHRRYSEIRQRLEAERTRCDFAARLAGEVAAAAWDCERLAALREGLSGQDLGRPPLGDIAEGLEARIKVCGKAEIARSRLEQGLGDCPALTDLDHQLGEPALDSAPLVQVRERLDEGLDRCRTAEKLEQDLAAANGDCEALTRLDRELAAEDTSGPPLQAPRQTLDAGLALCAKADEYRKALVDAQMDCIPLRALAERMSAEDTSREPLASPRKQLDERLAHCQELEKQE